MTPLRFESEELDEASLDYLRSARESEGEGMPGVYFDEHDAGIRTGSLIGWGALVGAGLLLMALIFMYSLNLHDPFRTSLLVTAMSFLGGWLLLAWIRTLISRSRANYIGYFKYVDPLYLWHGTGTGVWVTPLGGLQEARSKHDYSGGGGYKGSNVHIVLEDGVVELDVKSEHLAEGLEKYLEELVRDRKGLPVERGYSAMARAGLDDRDPDDPVEGIPEPHKDRTAVGWLFVYPALVAGFALTWFCVYGMSKAWHDSAVFDVVKDRNVSDLRYYIADPRNTANRETVLKMLKGYHEMAAQRLEAQPGEPAMKSGLGKLIRSLDASPAPVVTVAFARPKDGDPAPDTMDGVLGKAGATRVCTGVINRLGSELPSTFKPFMGTTGKPLPPGFPSDANDLGPQIVAFGEIIDSFAMILLDVKLKKPERQGDNLHQVVVTVRFQEKDNEESAAQAVKVSWKRLFIATNPAQMEAEFEKVCEEISNHFKEYLARPIGPQEKP